MRQYLFPSLLLGLSLLSNCVSDTEQQGLDAVSAFYGTSVGYRKGVNSTAAANELSGRYIEVNLSSAGLAERYGQDLEIPAGNCATLLYRSMSAAERDKYDYVRVKLVDSAASHIFSLPMPLLAQAEKGTANLKITMAGFQRQDYQAVAQNFNPAALGSVSPDSVPAIMSVIGQRLGPFARYDVHGYFPVTSGGQHMLRFYVVVPPPQGPHRLTLTIDPKLREGEKFLQAVHLLD